MRPTFHDLLFFLTGVAIPTYNVFEWGVKHFGKRLKRLLIRNEQEAALYREYKAKAMQSKVAK